MNGKRRFFNRRGGAALEAAVAMPFLVTMIFGIIDYTWYIMELETVVLATQAGVRAGAQTKLSNNPITKANTAAASALSANFPGPLVSPTYVTTNTGNVLRTTVTTNYTPLIGLVPIPSILRYSAAMRIEDIT